MDIKVKETTRGNLSSSISPSWHYDDIHVTRDIEPSFKGFYVCISVYKDVKNPFFLLR